MAAHAWLIKPRTPVSPHIISLKARDGQTPRTDNVDAPPGSVDDWLQGDYPTHLMNLPRTTSELIITIDGPAGSGKSTLARLLAERLGMQFLDTGAMYRAVAAEVLSQGVDPADEPAVGDLAEQLHLRFNWSTDPPAMIVDGRDLTYRLRDADVTEAVSDIAGNRRVRQVLVRAQRRIGYEYPRLVTEGRDQGSVVFVQAGVKFYLDASAEVRAERRARQLEQAGREVDRTKLLQQIIHRDQRDRTRADGPLVCPADAIVVDTSNLSLQEVLDRLVKHVGQALERPEADR